MQKEMEKNTENCLTSSLQKPDLEGKADSTPPGGRPVMVRDVRTAKRLLGKIILQIQRGQILSETARLLTYCLSTYVSICKDHEFEDRLEEIEKQVLKRMKK